MVWESIIPAESELARVSGVEPVYTDVLNGFTVYKLDNPIIVSEEFYIGWTQFRRFEMNVGYDISYANFSRSPVNQNLFYKTKGSWRQSSLGGTPMIRPLFTGDISINTEPVLKSSGIDLYPNPTQRFDSSAL